MPAKTSQRVRPAVRRREMEIMSFPAGAGGFISASNVSAHLRAEPGSALVPTGILNSSELFTARVFGDSMWPRIRNGDWAIFSRRPPGSLEDRLVLVEEQLEFDHGYTLKKLRLRQLPSGCQEVWLAPLNPAFPPIRLQPDAEKYRILGWYVASVRKIARVRTYEYSCVESEP